MQVLRRTRFVADLAEAHAYIAERDPVAAERLLDDVEAIASLLSLFPELGRRRDELRMGVRSVVVRRYRHVLFYRHQEATIVLLRLLHGAREARTKLF